MIVTVSSAERLTTPFRAKLDDIRREIDASKDVTHRIDVHPAISA